MAAVSSPDALRLWLALVVILGWAIVVGTCGGKPLSGEELVQERCTKCHTVAPIEAARKTRAEWQRTVYRMLEKGARLNDREAQEAIDYLSSVYGAESP